MAIVPEDLTVHLLTFSEAAARVGVSEMTIRRRVQDGTLATVQQGARPRIRPSDLERLYPHVFGDGKPRQTLPTRVVAFANQKGGVGKTTTCANLAAALAQGGASVLAIDCDPQGNLTQALGANPDALDLTLYNVLVEKLPLDRAMLSPTLGHAGPAANARPVSISLVGANLELAAADHQLAGVVAREMRLRQVLAPVIDRFEYLLLDCPPALGLLTLNALTAATEIVVPVDMGVFSLRGVAKLLDTISEVRSVNPGLTRVRALCNRSDNTNLSGDVRAELERAFGEDLFQTNIRRSVKVGEAQAARMPLTLYRPKDPAAQDYLIFAEEFRGASVPVEAGTKKEAAVGA